MALWQFDCYIIPREKCVVGSNFSYEDVLSWKKGNISSVRIDFLEKQASWTEDIVQYGKEDETCIKFLYEDGSLDEISSRFDLRSLSKKMLEKILDYVQEIEGMIFYEGKIYYPDMNEIVELMKKSNANKFCQNPKNYFDGFADNELI